MDQFSTAFLIAAGSFVAVIWLLTYADTVGPGITRVAHTLGRALVRLFTRNPQKD